jgi:hypothetical protein
MTNPLYWLKFIFFILFLFYFFSGQNLAKNLPVKEMLAQVLNFQILITYLVIHDWNFIQLGYLSFKTLNMFMIKNPKKKN